METQPTKISARQRELLKELKTKDVPSQRIAYGLYQFVNEKGESLLPSWKPIWESIRDNVYEKHILPESILLKIDAAIDALRFVDEVLQKLRLKATDRVCFLLGAGASASPPSSIPTVANLLPELWRRAGKIGRDDIDRLSDWCRSNRVQNIEDLLTAAYLANFAAKSSSITGLLNYFLFREDDKEEEVGPHIRRGTRTSQRVDASSIALLQDTLQVLFGLLTSTMIPATPNPGHDAIVSFIKKHSGTGVVTTNYDGCLDEAVIRAGFHLNTYADETRQPESEAIDLVKIHGSINWSYCESCHQVREFSLLDLKESYEKDLHSYAVIGICKNCGGQRRPLLIPPMGLKFVMFPNLIRLWNTARERLENAEYIIVVGFSFAEADSYISKIIERSMTRNQLQRIVICDPNPNLATVLRDRFLARIDGFEQSRVMSAMGSAHDLLPTVLSGMLSITAAAQTEKSDLKETEQTKAKSPISRLRRKPA